MLPMFIMLMLFMLIFLNPALLSMIGGAIGAVFYPVIGFEGSLPLLTILFASLIMGLISTLVRHRFINWVEMAKNQKVMSAFNKERRDALMSKNTAKLKKLNELQPEIMKKTMKASTSQLKPMMFIMVIMILFFAWLNTFLNFDVAYTTFAVPWNSDVPLTSAYVFPYWIMIYFLTSLPMGMMFQRVLKFYSFKKRILEIESGGILPAKKYEREDREKEEELEDDEEFDGDYDVEGDYDSDEEYDIDEEDVEIEEDTSRGKRKESARQRADINFTCTVCYKKVRKGSWSYKCKCGKYYHERCVSKTGRCPTCYRVLIED
jgi:uncharacterized membrane protein (DUF106 family)